MKAKKRKPKSVDDRNAKDADNFPEARWCFSQMHSGTDYWKIQVCYDYKEAPDNSVSSDEEEEESANNDADDVTAEGRPKRNVWVKCDVMRISSSPKRKIKGNTVLNLLVFKLKGTYGNIEWKAFKIDNWMVQKETGAARSNECASSKQLNMKLGVIILPCVCCFDLKCMTSGIIEEFGESMRKLNENREVLDKDPKVSLC